MTDRRPAPHSPLKAMIMKVSLWGGIPLALIALVVVFATVQPTAQSEAKRQGDIFSKMYNDRKVGGTYTPSR